MSTAPQSWSQIPATGTDESVLLDDAAIRAARITEALDRLTPVVQRATARLMEKEAAAAAATRATQAAKNQRDLGAQSVSLTKETGQRTQR